MEENTWHYELLTTINRNMTSLYTYFYIKLAVDEDNIKNRNAYKLES